VYVTNNANNFTWELALYLKNMECMQPLLNPLNAELNPICHFLALLRAHHILHISRVRVNPPLDGTLSQAQTGLKSAHSYLSHNKILKPTLQIC
jgi:hypothetical protein